MLELKQKFLCQVKIMVASRFFSCNHLPLHSMASVALKNITALFVIVFSFALIGPMNMLVG